MRRVLTGLLSLCAAAANAADGPTDAMMAPVRTLASCMAKGLPDDCELPFVRRGVVIAENFAPYMFVGEGAVGRWRDGFVKHLEAGADEGLAFRFGTAQDFNRSGNRVYFSLPTVWTGVSRGRHFEETGGWSFVLADDHGQFRIVGYAWTVIDLHEVAR